MQPFEYAIVRVVPRVEREEFVNVGVIVFCASHDFLEARIELDEARLLALDPRADLVSIGEHLAAIPSICRGEPDAGPIAALPLRERFAWLVSPSSAVLQTSPAHAGLCDAPESWIERLLERMVRIRKT